MFIQAYEEITSDEQTATRSDERAVLLRTIDVMEESDRMPSDGMKRVKAIHFVREVWSYFLNDLASSENATSPELKASLISIGIFIMKHLERMRQERTLNFSPLLEISKTIEKGLE